MDTTRVDRALARSREGNDGAADELLVLANEAVERIAKRFLSAFPTVAAWYETGDVRQLTLLRLNRTFDVVEIRNPAHFHRLIAQKVRQTLLDLKRQLHGREGFAANQLRFADAAGSAQRDLDPVDDTHDPRRLGEWLEIHSAIDALPDSHRQMFDMLWYGELTQEEVARMLGISVRHVRRRWREARLRLWEAVPDAFDS
jgi:RNA polymerase sigma factor (sigma-70 family)